MLNLFDCRINRRAYMHTTNLSYQQGKFFLLKGAGIPGFWSKVMRTAPLLRFYLTHTDLEILEYLEGIRYSYSKKLSSPVSVDHIIMKKTAGCDAIDSLGLGRLFYSSLPLLNHRSFSRLNYHLLDLYLQLFLSRQPSIHLFLTIKKKHASLFSGIQIGLHF